MVSKEELYVLIDKKTYRKNKSNILNGQAELLKIKKHIQNLRILSGQKIELEIKLAKILESTNKNIEAIQGKIPKPNIPKSLYLYFGERILPFSSNLVIEISSGVKPMI